MSNLFRSHGGEQDDVDLTNLIDLMVVICAVLMLTLPTYSAIATNMAKQDSAKPTVPAQPLATLSFSEAEELHWDKKKVSWDEAVRRIDSLKDKGPDAHVMIIGDERASYGFSVRLRAMVASRGLGVKELSEYRKDDK
jgi:biopolymer transport protein ExbD